MSSSEVETIWCIDCKEGHRDPSECPNATEPVTVIEDATVTSLARASIPSNLKVVDDNMGNRGVFVLESIPRKTQFGPFLAPRMRVDPNAFEDPNEFTLKVFSTENTVYTLDSSDENQCNWMCFIRAADTIIDQNLIAFQYKNEIFFTTTRKIEPGAELRVWYAPNYAEKLGKLMLNDNLPEGRQRLPPLCKDTRSEPMTFILDAMAQLSEQGYSSPASQTASVMDIKLKRSKMRTRNDALQIAEGLSKSFDITCKFCKKQLSSSTDLVSHFEEKHADEIIPCPVAECGKVSVGEKDFKDHYLNHDLKELECPVCELSFRRAASFIWHYKQHVREGTSDASKEKILANIVGDETSQHRTIDGEDNPGSDEEEEEEYDVDDSDADEVVWSSEIRDVDKSEAKNLDATGTYCEFCDRQYSTPSALKKHNLNVHLQQNVRKSYTCVICEKLCETSLLYRVHLKGYHQKLACQICMTVFQTKSEVKSHCKTSHGGKGYTDEDLDEVLRRQCHLCEAMFTCSDDVATHLEDIHSLVGELPCDKCSAILTTIYDFHEHAEKHKHFANCVQCGSEIRTTHLARHMAEVHGNREHSCPHCPYRFTTSNRLNSHVEAAHSGKTYVCEQCGVTLLTMRSLKSHLQEHGAIKTSGNKYKCKVCGAVYTTMAKLVAHKAMHIPEASNFQCVECQLVFRSKVSLRNHQVVHKKRQYQCEYCESSVTFISSQSYMEHILTHHRDQHPDAKNWESYECPHCDSIFLTLSRFTRHAVIHSEAKYQCKLCLKSYRRADRLKEHNCPVSIQRGIRRSYQCAQCDKVYSTFSGLSKHVRTHGTPTFFCEICGKTFFRKESLLNHIAGHKPDDLKDASMEHNCIHCGERFDNASYVTHIKDVHKMNSALCSKCGLIFHRQETYEAHMTIHGETTPLNKYTHPCKHCELIFNSKRNLKRHVQSVHAAVKAHMCDLCGKQFSRSDTLRSHIGMVHSEDKPFVCHLCSKGFKSKQAMTIHIKIHNNIKDFKCDMCDMSFVQRGNLVKHLQSHSGVKSFLCSECGRKFSTKESLKKHSVLHTHGKQYQCSQCPKKFVSLSIMRQHIRLTHDKKYCRICPECGTIMQSAATLKKHIQRRHPPLDGWGESFTADLQQEQHHIIQQQQQHQVPQPPAAKKKRSKKKIIPQEEIVVEEVVEMHTVVDNATVTFTTEPLPPHVPTDQQLQHLNKQACMGQGVETITMTTHTEPGQTNSIPYVVQQVSEGEHAYTLLTHAFPAVYSNNPQHTVGAGFAATTDNTHILHPSAYNPVSADGNVGHNEMIQLNLTHLN